MLIGRSTPAHERYLVYHAYLAGVAGEATVTRADPGRTVADTPGGALGVRVGRSVGGGLVKPCRPLTRRCLCAQGGRRARARGKHQKLLVARFVPNSIGRVVTSSLPFSFQPQTKDKTLCAHAIPRVLCGFSSREHTTVAQRHRKWEEHADMHWLRACALEVACAFPQPFRFLLAIRQYTLLKSIDVHDKASANVYTETRNLGVSPLSWGLTLVMIRIVCSSTE